MRFSIAVPAVGLLTTLSSGSTSTQPAAAPEGAVTGNVVVLSVDLDGGRETSVLLLVDERNGDRQPDGKVDRVFRLQAKGGSVNPVGLGVDDVEVSWTRERATAVAGNELKVTLTSQSAELNGPGARTSVHGFGLVHSTGWDLALPKQITPSALIELRVRIAKIFGNCDGTHECTGGGQGSTECGYTCGGESCSVTCSGGSNYACCFCGNSGKPCCKCAGGGPVE